MSNSSRCACIHVRGVNRVKSIIKDIFLLEKKYLFFLPINPLLILPTFFILLISENINNDLFVTLLYNPRK